MNTPAAGPAFYPDVPYVSSRHSVWGRGPKGFLELSAASIMMTHPSYGRTTSDEVGHRSGVAVRMVVGTLLGVWIGRDLRKEFAAPASGDGPPDGSEADDNPFAS
jgi:hypothetical protein